MRRGGGQCAIAPIGKTWMNGSTLRVRFMGGARGLFRKASIMLE